MDPAAPPVLTVDLAAQVALIGEPAETLATGLVRAPETAAAKPVAIALAETRRVIVGEPRVETVEEPRVETVEEPRVEIVEEPRVEIEGEPKAGIAPVTRATMRLVARRPVPPGAELRFNRAPMARFGPSTPRVG